jgi:hypothetical protein
VKEERVLLEISRLDSVLDLVAICKGLRCLFMRFGLEYSVLDVSFNHSKGTILVVLRAFMIHASIHVLEMN